MSNVVNRMDVLADKIGEVARDGQAMHDRHGGEILELRKDVSKTKSLAVKNREAILTAVGDEGKGGKLAHLIKQVDDHETRQRAMEKLMNRSDARQAIYASVFGALFATVLSVVANIIMR